MIEKTRKREEKKRMERGRLHVNCVVFHTSFLAMNQVRNNISNN